jgi:transcriptional regulator with XRE-family HTH domain
VASKRSKRTAGTKLAAPTAAEDVIAGALVNRVKELRRQRRWTLTQLSEACGVSRSMLSEIERNQANPTLVVAYRIARTFNMTLDDLVDAPGSKPAIDVIRADDRSHLYRSDKDCRIRTLSPLHMEKDVEFYELWLRRGAALRSAPHYQGTREFLTIRSGGACISSGDDSIDLRKGDSAHYRADVAHTIESNTRGDMTAYLLVTYQPP